MTSLLWVYFLFVFLQYQQKIGELNKFLEEITRKQVCCQINRKGENCSTGYMQQGATVEMGADLSLQNAKRIQDSKPACVTGRNEKPKIRGFIQSLLNSSSLSYLLYRKSSLLFSPAMTSKQPSKEIGGGPSLWY